MSEDATKAANMTAFKMALAPMQVIEKDKRIFVTDECASDGFIGKSSVDKVAGACCLFGFSGYYIVDSQDFGLCFRIY